MISPPLVQLLIRCRSSLPAVRERAVGELDHLDPMMLSVEDLAALVAIVPDLLVHREPAGRAGSADGVEGADSPRLPPHVSSAGTARRVLELLHCDLGALDSGAIERIYPQLPKELAPLIVGILARQHRPEAWLGLRRVLHLELNQPGHCAPPDDVLEPLGLLCDEPTFALDALLEAIDDPMWTIPAAQCIIAWHQRSLLSTRDIERVRDKIPVLEALIADSVGEQAAGGSTGSVSDGDDREVIDRLFPERPFPAQL